MTAITPKKTAEIQPSREEDYELLNSAVRKAGALANGYFKQNVQSLEVLDASPPSKSAA